MGNDARLVTNTAQETMLLSLKDYVASFQQYLVMHEFGHSLGLMHEHQRSDFWDVLTPLLDVGKIKSYYKRAGTDFPIDIAASTVPDSETDKTDYDPDSIMHYW